MENSEASNQLLKKKYDLHKTPEVELAANRHQVRTGERIPQDPLARIQNYLNRFHEIIDREDPKDREHGIDAIKRLFYRKYVIKPEEIPESYWENQRRIIRERGQGADLEQVDFEELKRQNTEAVVADQKSSLDKWIDYLSCPDADPYSDAFKYFTLRSVLSMGEYDKEKKAFTQRSKGTAKPFPDLNREALSNVFDFVQKKQSKEFLDIQDKAQAYKRNLKKLESQRRQGQAVDDAEAQLTKNLIKETETQQEALILGNHEYSDEELKSFWTAFQSDDFAKLYAFAIEKVTPADAKGLANNQGHWVKYNQGSDHMPLVTSLQGHGTGWCTAGESTAATQLKGGDFYVYYSFDNEGQAKIPRAAIRMEEGRIAEVRGIAPEQNLDSYIAPVVEEKLKEFPDGDLYQKKVADMKHLTAIEHKVQKEESLEVADLVFLYEIESPIQGFGYEKDPRIEEVRSQRNPQEDMPVVFGCDKSQIARRVSEISAGTKAYVGELEPGIFDTLSEYHIEHVYTSFPEGKIRRQAIEIGGKAKGQLQAELKQVGVNIISYAEDMLKSSDFTTLSKPQIYNTVRLKVADLGLSDYPTTDQVYKRAEELGLELCPAEVGPHYRLKYADQPLGEWFYIGMKQIADRNGGPYVFKLGRDVGGLWLDSCWAGPDNEWAPKREFVFGLRKKTQNPQSLGFFDRVFKR